MVIRQLNNKTILVGGQAIATPVVAMPNEMIPMNVLIKYMESGQMNLPFGSIQVYDSNGSMLSDGANSTRNQVIQSINDIGNILGG